jgi:hypothetical protein
MNVRTLVIVVLITALVVSCAGEESPELSPRARIELEAKVAAAKAAAAAHDAEGARAELAATRDRADALEEASQLSPAQAQAIRAAVSRTERLLDLVTTTTTTVATTLPPPVIPEPEGDTASPGKGDKGKGKAKGKG